MFQLRPTRACMHAARPRRPLHISRWNFTASNIRNIRSRERVYPSAIHSDGVIFDSGQCR